MSYLMPYQYYPLIGEIFGGDRETVKEFLLVKYKEYKESNPRFVQFIRDCITEMFSVVEPQNLEYKNQWLINNPDKELEEAPDRQSFYFDTNHFKRTFTLHEFKNLIDGFNDFVSSSKELEQIEKIKEPERVNKPLKLKWTGNKNQLYSVIRQLKNDFELITNSYNELAEFLISNVTGFENTSKETVEKELKKDKQPPKPRRVNINPEE